MFLIQHAAAGLWAFIWQWGLCVGLIVCLLAAAYFTTAIPVIGAYLGGARRDLLWAAFGVAVFLGGNFAGAKLEKDRCVAQGQVVNKTVDKAVQKAQTSKSKDPWDRSEY